MTDDAPDFGRTLSHLVDEQDGFTTSWLLIRSVTDGELLDSNQTAYRYTAPSGQPIHVRRGLVEMAWTRFDNQCRRDQ